MSSTYQPNANELKRRTALLKRVRPRSAWLRAYEDDVHIWASLRLPKPIPLGFGAASSAIVAFTAERSILFESDYLVGVLRPPDFRAAFGDLDAVAIAPEDPLPPLALMPGRPTKRLDSAARSILEHEFVHINQMIRGEHPVLPEGPAVPLLITWYEHTLRAEFEANFIQLATWPDLFPCKEGLTLEGWCAFRGYTQALESTLKLALNHRAGSSRLRQLVTYLLTSTRATMRRASVGRTHVEWLHQSVPALVRHAVSRLVGLEGHSRLERVVTTLIADGGPTAAPRQRRHANRDAVRAW